MLFKKCPDISYYFILNYFFILLLFFRSSFSFSVSKRVQILLVILCFNHILFSWPYFLHFLFLKLVHIIFRCNICLITKFFSIFQFSVFFAIKNWLFSIFLSIFFSVFSFLWHGFPSLYIHEILLKIVWDYKILYLKQFKWFLSNFMLFCSSDFFIYSRKLFEKKYEN